MIVSATVLTEHDLTWVAEGRRTVLVNRIAADAALTCVTCDNAAGARAIADHFHALGRRRVAFVAGLANTSAGRRGAPQRLRHPRRRTGADARRHRRGRGLYSYDAGYRGALELVRAKTSTPSSSPTTSWRSAAWTRSATSPACAIPGDIAVAGFDDIAMAEWPRYALTTYRQPVDAIVAATLRLIDGAGEPPPRGLAEILRGVCCSFMPCDHGRRRAGVTKTARAVRGGE